MRFRALGAVLLGLMSMGLVSVAAVTTGPGASRLEAARAVPAGSGRLAPSPRRRTPLPEAEGCFVPPPELVAVPPCTDAPVAP